MVSTNLEPNGVNLWRYVYCVFTHIHTHRILRVHTYTHTPNLAPNGVNLWRYVYRSTYMLFMCFHMNVYTYAYVYIHICWLYVLYVCVYSYMYKHVYMFTRLHNCMHILCICIHWYIYIYTCVCVCVYTHVYTSLGKVGSRLKPQTNPAFPQPTHALIKTPPTLDATRDLIP